MGGTPPALGTMGCDHSRIKELEDKNAKLEDKLNDLYAMGHGSSREAMRALRLGVGSDNNDWSNMGDDSNPLRLIALTPEEKQEAAKQTPLVHLCKPENEALKKECTDLFDEHAGASGQILLGDMKKEFPAAADNLFASMDFNGDGELVLDEFLCWIDQHFTNKAGALNAPGVKKYLKFLAHAPKLKTEIDEAEKARRKAQSQAAKAANAAARQARAAEEAAKVKEDPTASKADKDAATKKEADAEKEAKGRQASTGRRSRGGYEGGQGE